MTSWCNFRDYVEVETQVQKAILGAQTDSVPAKKTSQSQSAQSAKVPSHNHCCLMADIKLWYQHWKWYHGASINSDIIPIIYIGQTSNWISDYWSTTSIVSADALNDTWTLMPAMMQSHQHHGTTSDGHIIQIIHIKHKSKVHNLLSIGNLLFQ